MDAQVFGVLASFPVVFCCATIASATVIIILLQVTLQSFTISFCSFLAANSMAFVIGSRLGPILEDWYIKNHQKQSEYLPVPSTPILVAKKPLRSSDELIELSLPKPRNSYFFVALTLVIIVANLLGMVIGSYCAHNFPSRLH